jgi:hypothetical protein
MKRLVFLSVLMLIPYFLGAADQDFARKPRVTVVLKDGSTVDFKFDAITDTEVIGLDRTTLKQIKLPRNRVVSIQFGEPKSGQMRPGEEGLVLSDGTVIHGHIVGVDKDQNFLIRRSPNAEPEAVPWAKVTLVHLGNPTSPVIAPPTQGKRVVVSSTDQWADTGIDVKAGDRIWITAPENGYISCGAGAGSVNPDGANPFVRDPNRPLPDVKACALIGRIGQGAPFKIGLNRTPILAQESGNLRLGINDYDFRDNSGEWIVYVKTEESGLAGGANPPPPEHVPARETVNVPANQPWVVTNIVVHEGQKLSFKVPPGTTINCGPQLVNVNADGADPYFLDPKRPRPDLKACTLIGRVGNGQPFKIGLIQTPVPVKDRGKLALGINDYSFQDNSGGFGVVVEVE